MLQKSHDYIRSSKFLTRGKMFEIPASNTGWVVHASFGLESGLVSLKGGATMTDRSLRLLQSTAAGSGSKLHLAISTILAILLEQ